jgi:hypothetical protein
MAIPIGRLVLAFTLLAGVQSAAAQSRFTGPKPKVGATPVSSSDRDLKPAHTADARGGLRITKGSGTLPNEHGQVWREYDISPYTARIKDSEQPQRAITDWILRETGTDVWFAEPLGILNASTTTLRVYHTPEMHETVRGVVERFVNTLDEPHALGIRLITVSSPNWRAQAVSLLKPIDVKSGFCRERTRRCYTKA